MNFTQVGETSTVGYTFENNFLKSLKLVGCGLQKQPDLPFDFDRGSCNIFEAPEEKVFMCFSYYDSKQCRL